VTIPLLMELPVNPLVLSLAAAVLAYVLGSLSFAVIVSRAMRLSDPRTYGSGNPGATNVLRSGSKIAAVLTLVLDAAKGWLPAALVQWWGEPHGLQEGTLALVALAAFAGHLWPVFFGFKGGKGVATAAGVVLGISAWLGLAVLLVFAAVVGISRYVSLASMLAAVAAPVLYVLGSGTVWYTDARVGLALAVMAVLLIWRHQDNLGRLIQGKEARLGSGKKPHKS